MSTQITYTSVAGSETDFSIPFDYLRPEDLTVLVDGVAVSFSLPTAYVARLAVATSGGENVTVRRSTDIEDAYATFTEIITTGNLNNTILQLLYAAQEANTRIDSLNLSTLDPDYVPPATAADKVLLSANDGLGGFEWTVVDRASILDFTIPSPSGLADNTFIVAETNAYTTKTLAEVQALIGGVSSLPDPANQTNNFLATNASGDGYQLLGQSDARSTLGLGTAAVKNAGESVGNVVTVADNGDYGGTPGDPALPAINVGGLIGVAATPEYASFRRVVRAVEAENNIANGGDIFLYGAFEGSTPSWASAYDAGGANNVGVELLEAGTYEIEVYYTARRAGVFGSYANIELSGGTTASRRGLLAAGMYGGFGENAVQGAARLRVTVAANTYIVPTIYLDAGGVRLASNYSGAVNATAGEPCAYMEIKKVA